VSEHFQPENGITQGAVQFTFFFCVYIDSTLKLLASAGIPLSLALLLYTPATLSRRRIVLLAPTATAMRGLLANAMNMRANITLLSSPINLTIWSLYRIVVDGYTTYIYLQRMRLRYWQQSDRAN
jgi:hypothetical protein